MKIGIVTWHYHNNIGSNLQAYALQKTIQNLGYNVEFINYHSQKQPIIKRILKEVIIKLNNKFPSSINHKKKFGTYSFQKKYFLNSKVVYNEKSANKIAKNYNIVICGSDQIWAPSVFNPIYFLSFVPDDIPKISYAPSIGLNDIPKDYHHKYNYLLKRFQSISIREIDGQKLLKKLFDLNSTLVLDPTLLLDATEWEELTTDFNSELFKEKYVFCYFLGQNLWQRKLAMNYAKRNNLKLIVLSENIFFHDFVDYHYKEMDPCRFLSYIQNASIIFTDSYHGTIFSIIFKKIFYVFDRFDKNDINCQNSRINSLDKILNISSQRIKSPQFENFSTPNYDEIYENLSIMKNKSLSYLEKSIKNNIEDKNEN